MAAELFGYSAQQLIGIKMSQLFADTHREKQEALVEQNIEASGAVVMVNGKVVSIVNSDLHTVPTYTVLIIPSTSLHSSPGLIQNCAT